jgi:hypothetical protein
MFEEEEDAIEEDVRVAQTSLKQKEANSEE